jgi:hypothetical protein
VLFTTSTPSTASEEKVSYMCKTLSAIDGNVSHKRLFQKQANIDMCNLLTGVNITHIWHRRDRLVE